jgi:hypothetical protein
MPFIPVLGIVQAELVYLWQGQFVQNVLHYDTPGATTITEMEELGDLLVDWFDVQLQPQVTSQLSLVEVKLTDLTSEFGPVVEWTTGLPIVGTNIGQTMPNNVAIVMTKRTVFRGKSFRGRIYHPGLVEAQVTNNQLVPATQTLLLTNYNALVELEGAGGLYTLQVVSRYTNNAPREIGVATPVISITTDGFIDSQRRRLPGRGQ